MSKIMFEWEGESFTREQMLTGNAHDQEVCTWLRKALVGDCLNGCRAVAARDAHDEISDAILRADTIAHLVTLGDVVETAFELNEINCDQAALLHRSIARREDAIAELMGAR
jgi:hypothetical protein